MYTKKKFLCLTMYQGEVCTDDIANSDANDATNDDDAQWTKHDYVRLFG